MTVPPGPGARILTASWATAPPILTVTAALITPPTASTIPALPRSRRTTRPTSPTW